MLREYNPGNNVLQNLFKTIKKGQEQIVNTLITLLVHNNSAVSR